MTDDRRFYVNIPGTESGAVMDGTSFDESKDKLFEEYPDTEVSEMVKHKRGEKYGDKDMFEVSIPGTTEPAWVSGKDFRAIEESLYSQYSDVDVARMVPFNYQEDRAVRLNAIREENKRRAEAGKPRTYEVVGEAPNPQGGEAADANEGAFSRYWERLKQNTRRSWGDMVYGFGQTAKSLSRKLVGPAPLKDTELAAAALQLLEKRIAAGQDPANIPIISAKDYASLKGAEKKQADYDTDVANYLMSRFGALSMEPGQDGQSLVERVRANLKEIAGTPDAAQTIINKGIAIQDANTPSQEEEANRTPKQKAIDKAADLTAMVGSALTAVGLSAAGQPELGALVADATFAGFAASAAGASMRMAQENGANEDETLAAGVASAAVMSLIGKIPVSKYVTDVAGNAAASSVAKALDKGLGNEMETLFAEAAKRGLIVEGAKGTGKALTKEFFSRWAQNIGSHTATFGAMGGLNALIPLIYDGYDSEDGAPQTQEEFAEMVKNDKHPEKYPVLKQVIQSAFDSAIDGAIMGVLTGGIASGTELVQRSKRWKGQKEVFIAEVQPGADDVIAIYNRQTGEWESVPKGAAEPSKGAFFAEVLGFDKNADAAAVMLDDGSIVMVNNSAIKVSRKLSAAKAEEEAKRAYYAKGETVGSEAVTPEARDAVRQEYDYQMRLLESGAPQDEASQLELEKAKAAMQGRKDAVMREMDERAGMRLWREGDADDSSAPLVKSMRFVSSIRYNDGRELFIVGEDEENYAVADADGNKSFVNKAKLEASVEAGEATRTDQWVVDFVEDKVSEQDAVAERERMAAEQAANLEALRNRVQQEGVVNVGTPEEEVLGTVVSIDPAVNGGVVIQVDGEQQPRTMTWPQVAMAMRMPLEAKSSAEMVEDRIKKDEAIRRYNETIQKGAELQVPIEGGEAVKYQFQSAEVVDGDIIIKAIDPESGSVVDLAPEMITNLEDLANAKEIVPDVEGNPTPASVEGTAPVQVFDDPAANGLGIPERYAHKTKKGNTVVDGQKLWSENPKLWAQWNDRNPNRILPTKDYLKDKLGQIDVEVSKAKAVLEAELKGRQDPDRMEDLQEKLNDKVKRQQEIKALYDEYEAAERAAKEAEDAARRAEHQAKIEAKKQEAAQREAEQQVLMTQNEAFRAHTETAMASPKFTGRATKVYVGDQEYPAHYELVDVSVPLPSHNPLDNFSQNPGYPVDENGESRNTRAYDKDKEEQEAVIRQAGDVTGLMLQHTPTVSYEYKVVDGNKRWQAFQLAAANGTAAKYDKDLEDTIETYGFTKEQLQQMKDQGLHPGVVKRLDNPVPYTAKFMDSFNQSVGTAASTTATAAKVAKMTDDSLIMRIADIFRDVDDINAVYQNPQTINDLFNILESEKIIPRTDRPRYIEKDGKLTGAGEDFVESMLFGSIFSSSDRAVRDAMADKSIRRAVAFAFPTLVRIRNLSGEYSIINEMTEAVSLLARAKAANEGRPEGAVYDYMNQLNLFDGLPYEAATVQLLANVLNDKKYGALRSVLNQYIDRAELANSGQMMMFGDEDVESRETILRDVLAHNNINIETYDNSRPRVPENVEVHPAAGQQGTGGAADVAKGGVNPAGVQGEGNTTQEVKGAEPAGPSSLDTVFSMLGTTREKAVFDHLDKRLTDIDARIRKNPEMKGELIGERAEAIQEFIDNAKTVEGVRRIATTGAKLTDAMTAAGYTPAQVNVVMTAISKAALTNDVPRSFIFKNGIFIIADNIRDAKSADTAHTHEEEHFVTGSNGDADKLLRLEGANRKNLLDAIDSWVGHVQNYHEGSDKIVADEFISHAVERAKDLSDEQIDEMLSKAGIKSEEIVNFVKNRVNGRQDRSRQLLSEDRGRRGADAHDLGGAQINAGQDVRNTQKGSGGNLGEQGSGSTVSGLRRAGGGEGEGFGPSFVHERLTGISKKERVRLQDIDRDGKPLPEVIDDIDLDAPEGTALFSLEKDKKSLVGIHNISFDKLVKALRVGGLANPSAAVIDIERQNHFGYGDISLIMPSSLVDKTSGRNIGTFDRDAWTPTYPTIKYFESKKSREGLKELCKDLPEDLRYTISYKVQNYLDGDVYNSGLEYLFLKEKGMEIGMQLTPRKYPHASEKEFVSKYLKNPNLSWNGSPGSEIMDAYEALTPDERLSANLYMNQHGDANGIELIKQRIEKWPQIKERYEKPRGYADVDSFLYGLFVDSRDAGKESTGLTIEKAVETIKEKGLQEEFGIWQDKVIESLGFDEKFFDGWTPSGMRRYKANTLENVSKWMKKQGRNASSDHGLVMTSGTIMAKMAQKFNSLTQIRRNKGRLVPMGEEGDSYQAKIEDVRERIKNLVLSFWNDRISKESGLLTGELVALDYVQDFLIYGKDLDKVVEDYNTKERDHLSLSDEEKAGFNALREDIRNLPVHYFETKFERPVYLGEFKAAVVPQDTPAELKQALENDGLKIFEYDKELEGDRRRAMLEASEEDGVRFSFIGEAGAARLDAAEDREDRINGLAIAKSMESRNEDARKIKLATGWEKGFDGLWRYEMRDFTQFDPEGNIEFKKRHPDLVRYQELLHKSNMSAFYPENAAPLTAEEQAELDDLSLIWGKSPKDWDGDRWKTRYHNSSRLPDYIEDEELFKAYPKFRDTRIVFKDLSGKNAGGYADSDRNEIVVNKSDHYSQKMPYILIHEIQHLIQDEEGFSQGTSMAEAKKKAASMVTNPLDKSQQEFVNSVQLWAQNTPSWKEAVPLESYLGQVANRIGEDYYKNNIAGKSYDEIRREYNRLVILKNRASRPMSAMDVYSRTSGEVEARNVELRKQIGFQDLRSVLAADTEDVARKDQILNMPVKWLLDVDGITESLYEAQGKANKVPGVEHPEIEEGDGIAFSLTRNNRSTIESWLNKRKDLDKEAKETVLAYIDELDTPRLQLATGRWFAQGTIRLPEDMPKVEQAVSVAEKAKVDPLQYKSPMELMDAHADFKPTEKRINPDEVSTLHKAKEYPDYGIVVYDVDDTNESRQNMRQIINTHFGKDASPWCLLQGDEEGNLTDGSAEYWGHYNAYPKQVAFKDGKLLAFSANDKKETAWWDRRDISSQGIPIIQKIPDDDLGRTGMYSLEEDGQIYGPNRIWKGAEGKGLYEEWSPMTGALIARKNYTPEGQYHGMQETWWPTGQKRAIENYVYGQADGVQTYYRPDGTMSTRGTYSNGNLLREESFHENGNPKHSGNWEGYKRVGLWREFYEDGSPFTSVNYVNGKKEGVYEVYNRDGSLRERIDYKNGEYDGISEMWANGNLVEHYEYKDGKRHGLFQQFFTDGTPYKENRYVNGALNGLSRYWGAHGNLVREVIFKNDSIVEQTEYFNTTGTLSSVAKYDDDHERHGVWKEWDMNGKVVGMRLFEHGKLVRDLLAEGVTEEDADNLNFSFVTDEETLDRLEKEPTLTVYRAMALVDGKLYPPMSSKEPNAKSERGKKLKMRPASELGRWEKADEAPDKAYQGKDGKWYFDLKKSNGKDVNGVLYNPYIHTSTSPLNDQFTGASEYPELVTVEMHIPVSELAGKYKAEKANDSVGPKDWHSGTVTGQLGEGRQVILTRFAKPIRIVPDSEVAAMIAPKLIAKDITVPSNVVTPSMRAALETRGVKFAERFNPDKESIRFSMAYHGSSADFDKFDLKFLSTGEGSQEYGIGVYVTDVESTGRMYAGIAALNKEKHSGEMTKLYNRISMAESWLERYKRWRDEKREMLDYKETTDEQKAKIRASLAKDEEEIKDRENKLQELYAKRVEVENRRHKLADFTQDMENPEESPRHLYTVEIPDDNGENYLEWNKNLTDGQIERIIAAAQKYKGEKWEGIVEILQSRIDNKDRDRDGETIVRLIGYQLEGIGQHSRMASNLLKRAGFVGMKVETGHKRGGDGRGMNFVIYSPKDIQITEHIRFSLVNENQQIFVSNAAKAVEEIKQEKATPEQWLKMIEGKGGLKAGEDKWLGLSDWIKAQDRKTLTKQEIADYIAENRIQIEETHYKEGADLTPRIEEAMEPFNAEWEELLFEGDEATGSIYTADWVDYAWKEMVDRYGDDFESAFEIEGTGTNSHLEPIRDYDGSLEDAAKYFLNINTDDEVNPIDDTRLDYTTEGLENKAEIALTVPTIDPYNEHDTVHFGDAGEGRAVAWIRFGDTMTEKGVGESPIEVKYIGEEPVDEPHRRAIEGILLNWNDMDSVMRNERRDRQFWAAKSMFENSLRDNYYEYNNDERILVAQTLGSLEDLKEKDFEPIYERGKRVLVIDEIQSKRHQDAREKGGYREDKEFLDKVQKDYMEADMRYYTILSRLVEKYNTVDIPNHLDVLSDIDRRGFDSVKADRDRALSEYNKYFDGVNYPRGVPAAPFEKNWHELAMKRMLRYAAENGYDYIAWTTGEQQAERYNIGGIVDKIDINPGNKEGVKDVSVTMKTGQDMGFDVDENGKVLAATDPAFVGGKTLSDYLGKELAVKVLSSDPGTTIDGDNLRIGGEGMKGFYDEILPRFMDKYGKKWGVKVSDMFLPNIGDDASAGIAKGLTMHSVPVTQEMKESVMEGQPMFSMVGDNKLPVQGSLFDEEGEPVKYESLGGLPKGEEGKSYVERTFRKTGVFSFTGKEKIESAADVAYIFKELENSAVENAFLVFEKNGIPTIIHAGVGDISSVRIDRAPFVAGIKDFAPDKIYMVHNHPSGKVEASAADKVELHKLQEAAGDIPVKGIVIDTLSGEYGLFDDEVMGGTRIDTRPGQQDKAIPLDVLTFDKMVFSPEYKREVNSQKPITGPEDVAAYISAHRLGEGSKINALLLDTHNRVVANLVLNTNTLTLENAKAQGRQVVDAAVRSAATNIILNGDFEFDKGTILAFKQGVDTYSVGGVHLTDMVKVDGKHTLSLREGTLKDEDSVMDPADIDRNSIQYKEMIKKAAERIEDRIAQLLNEKQSPRPEKGDSADLKPEGNYSPANAGAPSTAPSANISKKIKIASDLASHVLDFVEKVNNDTTINAENFGEELVKSLHLVEQNQASKYIKVLFGKDDTVTLRIADHSGDARSIILRGIKTLRGVSLVLRGPTSSKQRFRPNKWANVVEYVYDNPTHDRLVKIAKSLFGFIDEGYYYDLANADNRFRSPRDGELKDSAERYDAIKAVEDNGNAGFASVLGEENLRDFYDSIYRAIPKESLRPIVQKAVGDGLNIRPHLDSYLHELAKAGPENDETGLLRAIYDEVRDLTGNPAFSDNDIRYMIWKSTSDAKEGDILALAEDLAMRNRWGVGKDEPMFSMSSEFAEATQEGRENYEQTIKDATKERDEKRKSIKNELRPIVKAMSAQKVFDQATVDGIVKFAKQVLKNGGVDSLTLREANRLLTLVSKANGKSATYATRYADQLTDLLLDHIVKKEKQSFLSLAGVKGSKTNKVGVEAMKELDVEGQVAMKAFRDNMDLPVEQIDSKLAEAINKMESPSDAASKHAEAEYKGLMIARDYQANLAENIKEGNDLENELDYEKDAKKAGAIDKKSYDEFVNITKEAIRENKMIRVDLYREYKERLANVISGGKDRAAEFREAKKQRTEHIHHLANSDMSGIKIDTGKEPEGFSVNLANNPVTRLLASPLATFEQLLRLFGTHSIDGKGYLYQTFMQEWDDSSAASFKGVQESFGILDKKAKEVFGDDVKDYGDIIKVAADAEEKFAAPMEITYTTPQSGKMTKPLHIPEALYIYAVNKMIDGKMKLRAMGISEDNISAIKANIMRADSRLIDFVDWVQDEFLVERRNRYNAVHEAVLGAPMAAIEDYFPLKINKRERYEERSAMVNGTDGHIDNVTGSIIARKKNTKPLDIENSNFFAVLVDHIRDMEDWAAYAQFREDLKALLSYNRFMNHVISMSPTIYGSGEGLWSRFVKASAIAAGQYYPSRSEADRLAVSIAQGATSAAINLRLWTAAKQMASFVTFFADANPAELVKSYSHPKASWDWCMKNLPLFEKRWKEGNAGYDILEMNDDDWQGIITRWRQKVSKVGMKPNRFVDALTVAVGAKAVYETEYHKLIKAGFDEETAVRKAKIAADIAFNSTQQSSEKAFVSAVQAERSWYASLLTMFRNGPMGFTRRYVSAVRDMAKFFDKAKSEDYIEFETKKAQREGLDEDQAYEYAKKKYKSAFTKSALGMVVMGFLAPWFWNLMGDAPYLIFGKDREKKKEKLKMDTLRALTLGWAEGFLLGPQLTTSAYDLFAEHKINVNSALASSPFRSEIETIAKKIGKDNMAALSESLRLAAKITAGADMTVVTDVAYSIIDACNGDLGAAKESMMLIMRLMSVPQSQLKDLYIDELDMTALEARGLSYPELARRYAEFKVKQGAPLTHFFYSDLEFEKRVNDRRKQLDKDVSDRRELDDLAISDPRIDKAFNKNKKVAEDFKTILNRARNENDTETVLKLEKTKEMKVWLAYEGVRKEIDSINKQLKKGVDKEKRETLVRKRTELERRMLEEITETE